jgi:hypothetical protein
VMGTTCLFPVHLCVGIISGIYNIFYFISPLFNQVG